MVKQGKVCEKHQEFSRDGVCRWCPTPPPEAPSLGELSPFARASQALIAQQKAANATGSVLSWNAAAAQQQQASQQGGGLGSTPPPPILPVASCKHDGVLLDYCGTTSCAACGKILSPLATAVRRIGASAMDVGFEPVTYMGCTEWRGSICAAPASTGCPLCGSARCPEHPYVRHNKGCPHWKAP